MSTRANIIIQDESDKLFFYRHSDGYPEGCRPALDRLLDLVKAGKLRDNVGQCAGWLIIFGAIEYASLPKFQVQEETMGTFVSKSGDLDTMEDPEDWKVGAFEPTTCIHGDIEYLYILDLSKKTIEVVESSCNNDLSYDENWEQSFGKYADKVEK